MKDQKMNWASSRHFGPDVAMDIADGNGGCQKAAKGNGLTNVVALDERRRVDPTMFHWNIDHAFLRDTRAVVSNRRVTTGIGRGTFTGTRAKMLALIQGHKVSVDSGRESTRNFDNKF